MDDKKGTYCYEYPRPAMTADCAIFGFDGRCVKILLIERGLEPYKGMWALPGGFMHINESIEECARRELAEETGVDVVMLKQFGIYSKPDRDPRGRVVTVAFLALVPSETLTLHAGDDATAAAWFNAAQLPPLAFDHQQIVADAEAALRREMRLTPAAFKMLGQSFTMTQLRLLFEWAAGTKFDRRNFERKIMATGMIEERNDAACNFEDCCCEDAAPCAVDATECGAPSKDCSMANRRPGKRWFAFNNLLHKKKDDDDDELDNPLF